MSACSVLYTNKNQDLSHKQHYFLAFNPFVFPVCFRCTHQNITVQVLDENDNSPVFKQPIYSVTLSEDAQLGTYVTTVRADDLDSSNAPVYWNREKV